MPRARSSPEVCPVCGAAVAPGARACPECGADERTGWNEAATLADGLDLPDESFNREAFEEVEFGRPRRRRPGEKFWLGVAVVALAAVTALYVLRLLPLHG